MKHLPNKILNYFATFTETRFNFRRLIKYKWSNNELTFDLSLFPTFQQQLIQKIIEGDLSPIAVKQGEYTILIPKDLILMEIEKLLTAAESALPFVIDSFNGFRHHDPDLQERRDEYESFLHEYVHYRIGDAIRQKLGGSAPMEAKLRDVLALIGTRSIGNGYEQLESQVSMALFEGKTRLMHEFQSRIQDLAKETGA